MTERDPTMILPTLPIKNTVLYPFVVMPVSVARPSSRAAVDAALAAEDKMILIVAQRDPSQDSPTLPDLYNVGCTAVIKRMARNEDNLELVLQGVQRVELLEGGTTFPYLRVRAKPLPEPTDAGPEVLAMHREVLDHLRRMHQLTQGQESNSLPQLLAQANDPLVQCYMLASVLALSLEKEQNLLEAPSRLEALRLMRSYLSDELQILELRMKIANQAETEMSKEKREYVLRQQMRAIQDELGERSPEQAEIELLRERLRELDLPDAVRAEAERELHRLERLSPLAPDTQLLRGYLELLLDLPWQKQTTDNLDLENVQRALDQDHFDLEEIKQRIIEHLAVLKLNPRAKAPILCFVGPPGVGKTSLGTSIARALGRAFERLSLGGMHDEAELRGHRRTYIGAMPGRILQALRRAGVNNPVLMLDELDKLGRDFRGDPAAALLEILDPAQNHTFRDNYLNLPFDLSKIFFITTANTTDTVPRPLLDRMELLQLSGYTDEEKREIATRYLLPRQLEQAGLDGSKLIVQADALGQLVRRYTREAGVRELERALGRLARKVAVRFASGDESPVIITPANLSQYLGPERFFAEDVRATQPAGVATGLAWTEAGGDVLYVEAVLLPHGNLLTLTGQLGNVMKESAQAAQSYVLSRVGSLRLPTARTQDHGVHIHVPAGAIPKDGPSAGVTIATALASLYADLPARADTAMTGELTLTGLVLPVGGIKEKVLAAQRAGIRQVILPARNENDLHDLPPTARSAITFHFAHRIEDVWRIALPDLLDPNIARI